MQAINQRTPEQAQALERKRKVAQRQYWGASCVFQHCMQLGIHVSWEWAQKCHAWRLPVIQKLTKKYVPYFATTQGCQVNLRDPQSHQLLHKGWKVMTTHSRLAELLNMPCRCPKNYKHARCEGGLAGISAYYTPEFVKRVCHGIQVELSAAGLQRELQGSTSLLSSFGEGSYCVCQDLLDHDKEHICGACHTLGTLVVETDREPIGTIGAAQQLVGEKDVEAIKRKLYLLHASTGHCSTRHLVQALQRRGAGQHVLDLAKEFTCDICQERHRVNHKNAASLESLPPKLATISADGGHWRHPGTGEEHTFALVLDEGSRFRVARILRTGKKQSLNAAQFLGYLREGWIQYFGKPQTLRVDPAGAFRSREVEKFCDDLGILLDVVPGEAHWKIGACEQAIQGVKEVMSKLVEHDHELSAEGALAEAVRVFNSRELVRGFSPVQHLLGRAPDETGRFVTSLTGEEFETFLENPNMEFELGIHRMKQAEQALSEWQAHQRVNRALNSRPQRMRLYYPGDLVYFWRKQVSNQNTGKHGQFVGPGRILATETKRDADGQLAPSSSVWVVRGRRLLKCSVDQLRPASRREHLLEHLGGGGDPEAPWTFPRIAGELGGNEYEDISGELPDADSWEKAQDVTLTVPPQRRLHGKQAVREMLPVAEPRTGLKRDEPEGGHPETSSSSRGRLELPDTGRAAHDHAQSASAWWCDVPDTAYPTQPSQLWEDALASVEIEVELPATKRGYLAAFADFEGFMVTNMKRRAIELTEKRMTPDELRQFQEAKGVEVRNFIAARAFEALPDHLKPNRSQAIGMRWILTWKTKDDGSKKAKARAILKGFQDPKYEYRATTTPVMTRQTRQLMLQVCAHRRWRLRKGDVSGAFLQGREYPGDLYCVPVPEILTEMNLSEGEIVKVKRGCYGLVDAPLEWYLSVSEVFESLGLRKTWADPCCWSYHSEGKLVGLIAGHVDDFLFGGDPSHEGWKAIEKAIQARFKWTDWEEGAFTQCGVRIELQADGSYHLSQPSYLDNVSELNLSATRRRQTNEPATEVEKTALRGILGALSWHAQQVSPHLSAVVSLLLSEVQGSTVETVLRVNKTLYQARQRTGHKLIVHAFEPDVQLGMYAWVDAAGQNRARGESTQGIFIGIAPTTLLEGCLEKISPVAWHSSRIDRVVRSPGAAEAKAMINGEDLLYHARYQYGEWFDSRPCVFDVDRTVNLTPGCVISDSRTIYDKLMTEELSVKGAERRTDLELLCMKHAQRTNHVNLRWVHSESQIANALTKENAKELELFYKMNGVWRIVVDKDMKSARKRRQEGLDILAQPNPRPHTSHDADMGSVG